MQNNKHAQRLATYNREKCALIGREVHVGGPGNHVTTWKVVNDIKATHVPAPCELYEQQGVKNFDFGPSNRSVSDS
jgi:hypothetical protein